MSEQILPKTSALAITAFVLAFFGLCLPPVTLLALVLGIISIVPISKKESLTGQGLAIAATVMAGVGIFTSSVVLAIAIPAFLKYEERAKTSQAHELLHRLSTQVTVYVLHEA